VGLLRATLISIGRYRTYSLRGVVFVLVFTYLSAFPAYAKYSGGTGEANSPYLISTAADMNEIGTHQEDWGSHFLLTADINLAEYTGTEFTLIGYYEGYDDPDNKPFTGVFDGNGHTISNFTYESNGIDCIGLFRLVSDPNVQIKGLIIVDPNIDAGAGAVIGALIGLLFDGFITGCSVEEGEISGRSSVGGLVGCSRYWSVGHGLNYATISGCYATANVLASDGAAGGLVGWNDGKITDCYAASTVEGNGASGELVGFHGHGTINQSYATGSVSGAGDDTGGLVGNNQGVIRDSYATTSVLGNRHTGGLVGSMGYGIISYCYSAGSVVGTTDVGGLVGEGGSVLNVFNSFWDVQTSGQANSAHGMGKTTAEMQDPNTYIGWGCDSAWTLNAGVDYPRLSWEGKPGELLSNPSYGGGSGSETDPYLIYTAEQLNMIGLVACHSSKHFLLVEDINLTEYQGTEFNVIGNRLYSFTGIFDGNGHGISNYNRTGALFAYLRAESAMIKNLCLIKPDVRAIRSSGGALVDSLERGSVVNCHVVDGRVFSSGSNNVGGLVGFNSGSVSQCSAESNVSGRYYVGGLVGANWGIICESFSSGSVSGDHAVGGMAGWNVLGASISHCYARALVDGTDVAGGLVGMGGTASYMKCFWDSDVNPGLNGIGNMSDPDVIGKTTAEMQTESTFIDAGWDFVGETVNGANDIWKICDGTNYPKLAWQEPLAGDFVCPDGVNMRDYAVLAAQWQLEKLSADVFPDGGDGVVNFLDWSVFADAWQSTTDTNDLADFAEQWLRRGAWCGDIAPAPDGDGVVDILDFAVLAENWLAGM